MSLVNYCPNKGGTTVTKLRARDGATLGTFPLGRAPTGVAFDGTNIWVSTFNNSSNVVKLSRNGKVLRVFTAEVWRMEWLSMAQMFGWRIMAAGTSPSCQ